MRKSRSSHQSSRLNNYFRQHKLAFQNSLKQLSISRFATFITFMVIGIALALPTGLYVLMNNIQLLGQGLNETNQISLYLKADTPPLHVTEFFHALQNDRDINQAKYISPQKGLEDFQQQIGATNVLAELNDNPLPSVIVVQPSANIQTDLQAQQLMARLKQSPYVENAQLDMLWLKRLYSIINLVHHIIYAIMFFFGLAVLLIVGNTIRLTTQNFRDEIDVIQLLGGTNSFIRRPFLYSGMIYGFTGGLFAWLSVDTLLWWLQKPVNQLVSLYGSHFHLYGLGFESTFYLLIASAFLGYLGSFLAVQSIK